MYDELMALCREVSLLSSISFCFSLLFVQFDDRIPWIISLSIPLFILVKWKCFVASLHLDSLLSNSTTYSWLVVLIQLSLGSCYCLYHKIFDDETFWFTYLIFVNFSLHDFYRHVDNFECFTSYFSLYQFYFFSKHVLSKIVVRSYGICFTGIIMNARTQLFELSMEGRQVDEAVASIFHSVLFHRSLGKFKYKQEGSYSVGTVGYQDVDCDFIDFTYVCCSSVHLDQTLKREISGFSEALRSTDSPGSGQISLEFFQRKKSRWPFQSECIPWEVWTVRLELIKLATEHERQICREKVGDLLTDKILYITEVMNRHDYIPKVPSQAELDLIFDTSYPDIQPYLFKLSFTTSSPSTTTMGNTMKKLIRETLSI